LLESGANVNQENDNIYEEHYRLLSSSSGLSSLPRRGDSNLAKHDGCTPLWIAASHGNSECVRALINYGADINTPDKSQRATPLFLACQNGKKAAVDLLLANGADLNCARQSDSTSPLMISSHNGHVDIVDVLLKCGDNAMQANNIGLNALGCAAMQGRCKIVKLIYQRLKYMQNIKTVRDFANAGDKINGWTPLHLASMGGHIKTIKYLVYYLKVDIFQKDYEDKSALEHAWQHGHQNVVSWLSAQEQKHSSRD